MKRNVDAGITVGLVCVAIGCLFIIVVAQLVESRSDELEISIEARAGLEQELRQEREKYQRDMDGALAEIHKLRAEPNGPADADAAGDAPAE